MGSGCGLNEVDRLPTGWQRCSSRNVEARSGPVQPERCAVYTRVSSCKQVKPAVRFRRLPDGPLGEREGNERRKPLMDAERRRPMVALVIEEAPLVPAKMEERAVSAADAETTKHPGQHRDYPANW